MATPQHSHSGLAAQHKKTHDQDSPCNVELLGEGYWNHHLPDRFPSKPASALQGSDASQQALLFSDQNTDQVW
jgi:hypothetical protein